MKSTPKTWIGWSLKLAAMFIAACSGTDSGHLVEAPTALIATTGNQPTSVAGADPVSITVRSDADVQLSGEDSYGGNISITGFSWKQTDGASVPSVALLYRNASTVSFTAPSVAQNTTLNFQLTVTNASGLTGTASAQVLVIPANDPNQFLSLQALPFTVPPVPRHFRVGVSTVAGLTNLSADIPICVRLSSTVVYTPRSGAAESGSLMPQVQQVDARWLASAGGEAGFPIPPTPQAFTNPMVSFDLPVLNSEDIFKVYDTLGEANIDNELVPSDIDSAYVRMAVTATPGSCDSMQSGAALANSQLMLQLFDEAGKAIGTAATAPATGTAVTIDSSLTDMALTPDGSNSLIPDDFLRAQALLPSSVATAPTQFQTSESAKAYYLALDPASAKITLPEWLSVNCFDPNNLNFGAGESGYSVVHAEYTNNFDLGFGRDMYFANCANGNMASVVINYPSLGAAVNKVGAFLAVAMEYSPSAGSSAPCFTNPQDSTTNTGNCFAKFYAFAPDDRDGVFKRVLSVNFDRRGQKYLPGACTICHGGTSYFKPGQAYVPAANLAGPGDVDATFMSWDLSSLLFADSDPAFPCAVSRISPVCQSINQALYTKASQASNIQQLNGLAWRTYQHPEMVQPIGMVTPIDRYQAPRDLLTKWYGGDPAASTAHAFDDSVTPGTWMTESASSPTDLYHQVFVHHCRSCHTQMNGGPQLIEDYQFQSLQSFEALAKPVTTPRGVVPASMQPAVFQTMQMPQSRLTADRLWVGTGGAVSAAQALAQFINGISGAPAVALDSQQNVIGPGAPVIVTTLNGTPLPTTAATPLNGLQGITLDAASQSYFVSSYQWTLCPGTPPPASGGSCSGFLGLIGTPIVAPGGSTGLAQSGAAYPAFPTTTAGTYYLTVTVGSSVPGAPPTAPVTYPLVIQ